jgi:predicted dehydrogenase
MPVSYASPAAYVPDADRPLRWGVVGTGVIARVVMSDLLLVPDAELVGVCSRSTERADAFAAALSVPDGMAAPTPTAFTSVADMLPEIDVLYVATPHAQHVEPALAALESGTAVLCEKAITVHYEDAVQLVEAARRNQTFLMEAVWMRFNPLHVRMRELISEGVLGDLLRVVADFSFVFPYDPSHRLFDPAQGGGTLLDMGPYPVGLVQSLMGDPDSIAVHGNRAPNGVDETATVLMRYPLGAAGVATCSLRLDGPRTASVMGTSGAWFEIHENALCPERVTLHRPGLDPEDLFAVIEGSGYVPQLREVQMRVRAGEIESPVMPHRDTLATMRILTDTLAELGVTYA